MYFLKWAVQNLTNKGQKKILPASRRTVLHWLLAFCATSQFNENVWGFVQRATCRQREALPSLVSSDFQQHTGEK